MLVHPALKIQVRYASVEKKGKYVDFKAVPLLSFQSRNKNTNTNIFKIKGNKN